MRLRLSGRAVSSRDAEERKLREKERLASDLARARDDKSVQERAFALYELGLGLKDLGRFSEAAWRFEEAEGSFVGLGRGAS